MKCPVCNSKTQVNECRLRSDSKFIRRRECLSCGKRFTTAEAIIDVAPVTKEPKLEAPPVAKKAPAKSVVRHARKHVEKPVNPFIDTEEQYYAGDLNDLWICFERDDY